MSTEIYYLNKHEKYQGVEYFYKNCIYQTDWPEKIKLAFNVAELWKPKMTENQVLTKIVFCLYPMK